jgi:hypothetical protein
MTYNFNGKRLKANYLGEVVTGEVVSCKIFELHGRPIAQFIVELDKSVRSLENGKMVTKVIINHHELIWD